LAAKAEAAGTVVSVKISGKKKKLNALPHGETHVYMGYGDGMARMQGEWGRSGPRQRWSPWRDATNLRWTDPIDRRAALMFIHNALFSCPLIIVLAPPNGHGDQSSRHVTRPT